MESSTNTCNNGRCLDHYHAQDPIFVDDASRPRSEARPVEQPVEQRRTSPERLVSNSSGSHEAGTKDVEKPQDINTVSGRNSDDHGFRRIILNFTPSWFIINMSTGVVSILLHQLPYNGNGLRIISIIFFVLNLALFILFTFISCLRYLSYPQIFKLVLRHPHQSLFLATFPVGFATIVNMVVLVCAPAWGHGMATLAWVLWWIVSVLAITTCFHLTFVIMSNRRSELGEMTALYFIPIVAVVIAATTGGLVAGALPNRNHQLWTLVISYVFWGIGTPLSWIILTLYFLRMTICEPLKREIIVSLLLPIGPLGLSGFSIIELGKLAKELFPATQTLPHVDNAGDVFYIAGFLMGLILWGFGLVWFIIAVIMITISGGFPFNMGWWGFIFPVGVFTLLTITIGEELESRFFKVLSCVLTGACVIMWLGLAAATVQRSITGEMFFAPCLGTNLFQKAREKKTAWSGSKTDAV